ncbi:MAG: isoleucine--tRNA ligase, partial [Polaribacter sp.]
LPDFLQNEGDVYFLAWTTTPWTLPSNTALTVGPKIDYVLVETYNQYTFKPMNVVLAKNLVAKQFAGKYNQVESKPELIEYKSGDKKIPFYVVKEFVGKDLVGIKYEQLIDFATPYQNAEHAFRVISGDFVTTEDGTGIVHTAPTFGADDALVAKQATPEIPPLLIKDENDNLVPLVDLQGRFRKEIKDDIYGFAGEYVKAEYLNEKDFEDELKIQQEKLTEVLKNQDKYLSVDERLGLKLKNENKAFKVEKYKHSYPNCWRTDKPILYYPLDSWFIKVTDVKDRMHSLNKTINWKPESTGTGRFGNWLANANDWNLSRSRYWGIPLPIWRTEDGKEEICIGSVKELKAEMAKAVEAGVLAKDIFEDFEVDNNSEENYAKIDLHKNIVDEIVLVSASGQPMKRESDLIDVWFDSGSMPYAQWHYPFENKNKIDGNESFPADFIAEGVDQTRGWFYTLHAIATMVFDSVAYKNVVSNGLVLDKNGHKMSKRLGNATDPFTTLSTYGADATRWYMISNANPWDNLKFDLEGIEEVKRKFFGTLYNTYSFFTLYTNIDGFAYEEADIPQNERPELDRWILSELHTLINKVDKFYAEYEPTRAARAISDFTQDYLSNWYVRLSRRRFWKGTYETDKISAYQTLYTCMNTIAKLSAPIAPFFMDRLYQDLNSVSGKETSESIHLSDFPKYDASFVDKSLERKMENAQTISSLVLSLRAKEKIKVRQPLQKIMIPVDSEQQKEEIFAVANLIKNEVNIKEIQILDDASDILIKQIKPNFKALGPKFGKDMRFIAAQVQQFNQEDINKIEKDKNISLEINGKNITLDISDVEISSKDIEGWLVANEGSLTVALDVTITEELRKEGVARELVNRIQNARKDTGLEVTDKIKLTVLNFENLQNSINENKDYIMSETLTQELVFVDELENGTEIEFDTIKSRILIEKI